MTIEGMFETKENGTYVVYNNINENSFDWKIYNSSLDRNPHELLEVKLDLKDVTLLGTEDFTKRMTEVINRFQVRVNETLIKFDAYQYCNSHNASCVINQDKSSIFNSLVDFKYFIYESRTTAA